MRLGDALLSPPTVVEFACVKSVGARQRKREAGQATQPEYTANSDDWFSRLGRLLQLRQMSQQFFFVGHATDVPADHLMSPQRRLATGPPVHPGGCLFFQLDVSLCSLAGRCSSCYTS